MEGAKLAGNAVPKFGGAGVHEHNKQVSTTTSHIRKVNAPNLFCGSERPGPPLARASSFPWRFQYESQSGRSTRDTLRQKNYLQAPPLPPTPQAFDESTNRLTDDVWVIFRRWLALKFPPCGALSRLVAVVNPCIASQQSPGVAVKPFAHFYIWILMVLEASGRCCESIIDGWKSRGGCREAICALFQFNIDGFGISRRLLWIH